ncbi:cora-domain-containing protein [Ceratobasidium sp. AG-I]|nr:cora-domain-containing protein [Ceratobasidium sp. AG-I]
MLGCIKTAGVLSRATHAHLFRQPVLFSASSRAIIHTGSNSTSNPHNSSYPELGRHFGTIESSNDREYLNGRCTTLRLPVSQSSGGSGTGDGGSSDANLQVEHAQKVSKVNLCRQNGIQPRDLRALDTDMRDLPSSILVRNESILFCTPDIRAIIKADKVLMFESLSQESEDASKQSGGENSPVVRTVMSHIQALIARAHHTPEQTDTHAPFEFTALESLLSQEVHSLSQGSSQLTNRVNALLSSMSSQDVISTAQMQEMIEVKDSTEMFLRAATSVKDAVAEILSEPDDMRRMYLTEMKQGKVREMGDDDEVELLLETYLKYATSLALTASRNLQRLNSASQHLTLLLSSTRNRLLHLEIRLAIATLAVSAGALPAALLGMNLTNHFEDHPWAFYAVAGVIAAIAATATQAGRMGLRVARRVKMSQAGLLAGGKRGPQPPTSSHGP